MASEEYVSPWATAREQGWKSSGTKVVDVTSSSASSPRLLSYRNGGPTLRTQLSWQAKFCVPNDVLTKIAAVAVGRQFVPQQKCLMDQIAYITDEKPNFTLSEYAMLLYSSGNSNARQLGEEIYNTLDQ